MKIKPGLANETNCAIARSIVKQQDLSDFQYTDMYACPAMPADSQGCFENGSLAFLEGLKSVSQFNSAGEQDNFDTASFKAVLSATTATYAFTEKCPEYPDNPIFLIIKANEKRNIDIAQSCNKWVFSPQTEKKVLALFGQDKTVYLVFFVKELQMFMGIAEYKGLNIGKNFPKPTASIAWKHVMPLHKNKTKHLMNPYNFGKPIHEAQDGVVIRQDVGEELVRIYVESEGNKGQN